MSGVVVVGGGLGGLRAVESLRAERVRRCRSPSSATSRTCPTTGPRCRRRRCAAASTIDGLLFRRKASVDDVTWLLGTPAVAADLACAHASTLDDGSVLAFDGLVIASGIRPRRLPIPGPADGRTMLRTVTDAERLRERLAPGVHVLIMGAGFIGCETAATARSARGRRHASSPSTRSR